MAFEPGPIVVRKVFPATHSRASRKMRPRAAAMVRGGRACLSWCFAAVTLIAHAWLLYILLFSSVAALIEVLRLLVGFWWVNRRVPVVYEQFASRARATAQVEDQLYTVPLWGGSPVESLQHQPLRLYATICTINKFHGTVNRLTYTATAYRDRVRDSNSRQGQGQGQGQVTHAYGYAYS